MSRKISPVESNLNRFHPVIYISIASLTLAAIVFVFYNVYMASTVPNDNSAVIDASFNKQTIDKIRQLQSAQDKGTQTTPLPEGRVNPFVDY